MSSIRLSLSSKIMHVLDFSNLVKVWLMLRLGLGKVYSIEVGTAPEGSLWLWVAFYYYGIQFKVVMSWLTYVVLGILVFAFSFGRNPWPFWEWFCSFSLPLGTQNIYLTYVDHSYLAAVIVLFHFSWDTQGKLELYLNCALDSNFFHLEF